MFIRPNDGRISLETVSLNILVHDVVDLLYFVVYICIYIYIYIYILYIYIDICVSICIYVYVKPF